MKQQIVAMMQDLQGQKVFMKTVLKGAALDWEVSFVAVIWERREVDKVAGILKDDFSEYSR